MRNRSNHGKRRPPCVSKVLNQIRQIHATFDLSLCRLVVRVVMLDRAEGLVLHRISHQLHLDLHSIDGGRRAGLFVCREAGPEQEKSDEEGSSRPRKH